MQFTTDEIAAVTDGSVRGPGATINRAAVDSRAIAGGELFVPLVAERDGHDFIPAALDAGAAAYLTAPGCQQWDRRRGRRHYGGLLAQQ